MNFFEQELRRLFEDGSVIQAPWFSGNNCRGTLDTDLRVRVKFTSCLVSGDYDGLALTVLNRTGGEVDSVKLYTGDIWDIGIKTPRISNAAYINRNNNTYAWRNYQPTTADYDALRKAVNGYLDVYRDRVPERARTAPIAQSRPGQIGTRPRPSWNSRDGR